MVTLMACAVTNNVAQTTQVALEAVERIMALCNKLRIDQRTTQSDWTTANSSNPHAAQPP